MKNNVDSRYLGVLSEVKSAMQPNGKGLQATILSSKGVATEISSPHRCVPGEGTLTSSD
jgi:hypothetical protein